VAPEHHRRLASVLALARSSPAAAEMDLVNRQETIPVYLSASPLAIDDWKSCTALVITDLTLRRRSEYIAAAERFARLVLDQAAEPIIVCDASGIVTHASLAAQSLCTASPLGRPLDQAFPFRPAATSEEDRPCEGIDDSLGIEVQMTCRGSELRYFIARDGQLKDAHGKAIGRIVTLADITDHKETEVKLQGYRDHLETMVAERTAELLTANQELEGFTFATSHDLRGPLGRINSFSALLEQEYRDRLSGNGLLFLGFIRQNATRLMHLVDDLLSHARAARSGLELQTVDLLAQVRSVLEERAGDLREAGAEVRLELAPMQVIGDPQALNQALGNLVENALKYSVGTTAQVITIGGEKDGDRCRLWVRDNGIGFDMAYHDRIFEIFRRLHTYSEYEGSGVGLALVKRAIERMGGKVWAESQPGQGATFFLELQIANQ
jgi:signal transduction histidine kinase